MLCGFSGPDWNDGVEDTRSATVDETGEDHPGRILSSGLEGCSEDTPDGAKSNGLDTSVLVTSPSSDETADKSTEIVNGDLVLVRG